MSDQDERVVRELYRAFTEQDVPAMQRLFDPDVVWHQPGRSVLAGEDRGVDAVLAFFGRVAEISQNTFTVELHDVVSGSGHTVGLHTGRGQAGTRTLLDHNAVVVHCRAGRVAELWEHHADLYAVDEFWGLADT